MGQKVGVNGHKKFCTVFDKNILIIRNRPQGRKQNHEKCITSLIVTKMLPSVAYV